MNTDEHNFILGLPRRPRGDKRIGGTGFGAIIGYSLGGPLGAVLGGLAGNALAHQPLNLEAAVRNYFLQNNLPVIFVYRSPKAIEVVFKYNNQFWSVKTVVPDTLQLKPEDVEDWLYGNLVKNELPKKLNEIRLPFPV